MLKSKINKDAYAALNDVLKAEYKADGENYVLDTDDGGELRTALVNAKKERDDAKKALTDLQKDHDKLKADGNVSLTLENSYKEKIAKLDGDIAASNTTITKLREDAVLSPKARELAAKNFTVPSLLEPKIRERMELDPRDNTTIRWKDATGKVSALTEADIVKELVDNAEFKSIVVANRASGGAGNAAIPGGTGAQSPYVPPLAADGKTPKRLVEMSAREIVAHNEAKAAAAAQQANT